MSLLDGLFSDGNPYAQPSSPLAAGLLGGAGTAAQTAQPNAFGQPLSPLTTGLFGAAGAAAQMAQPSRLPTSPLATLGTTLAGFGQGVQAGQLAALQQKAAGVDLAGKQLGVVDQLSGVNARRAFDGLPALSLSDLGVSGRESDVGSASGVAAGDGTAGTVSAGSGTAGNPSLLPGPRRGTAFLASDQMPTLQQAMAEARMAYKAGYKEQGDKLMTYALNGVEGRQWGPDGALRPISGGPADPATWTTKALADKGFVQDATGAWRNPAGAVASQAELAAATAAATTTAQEQAKLPYSVTQIRGGSVAVPTAGLLGGGPAAATPGAAPASGGGPTVSPFATNVMKAEADPKLGPASFLDGTWLEKSRQYFPDVTKGLSDDQLLALRQDPRLNAAMTDAYARENGQFLQSKGLDTTPGNLYLGHFLGPAGAAQALRMVPSTPVSLGVGKAALDANPWMSGATTGQLRQAADIVAATGTPMRMALDQVRNGTGASAPALAAPVASPAGGGNAGQLPGGLVRLPGGGLYNPTPAVTQVETQTPYKVESQKNLAEMMKTVQEEGAAAPAAIRQINELRGAMSGLNTGPATITLNEAAAAFNKMTGLDINKFLPEGLATDPIKEQIAAKNINELATAMGRSNFAGNKQFTNADLEQSIRSTPNLFNLPGANKQLLDSIEQVQRIKIDRGKFFRDYERQHGGALDYGVHDDWNTYLQNNPNIPEPFKDSALPLATTTARQTPNPMSAMPPNTLAVVKDRQGNDVYHLQNGSYVYGDGRPYTR